MIFDTELPSASHGTTLLILRALEPDQTDIDPEWTSELSMMCIFSYCIQKLLAMIRLSFSFVLSQRSTESAGIKPAYWTAV